MRYLILAATLALGIAEIRSHAGAEDAPASMDLLAEAQVGDLGTVSVSAPGERALSVRVEHAGSVREQRFELDALPAGARVRAATLGAWQNGVAVGLAIEEGSSTSYRYLISDKAPARPLALKSSELVDRNEGWCMSQPLFVSSGAPYRIVEVHCPGSDALEITFRRGWPSLNAAEPQLDERVLFDSCPGASSHPLGEGRAELYEVAIAGNAR